VKVGTSHDDFSQFPVESIARFLAVCGYEDPTLLRRSRVPPDVVDLEQLHMRLPPPLRSSSSPRLPAGDTSDQSGYLEELVAIAVSSARQAEDTLQRIRAASATARRRLLAISAVGAIGLVLGIVGISGAGFSLDISGLFPKSGHKFASVAEHQSPDPGAIVVGHPPPVTASTTRPPGSQLSEGLPHDRAMIPRAAEPPPLALAPAQALPAKLTEHQSLEAMLHENAAGAMDGVTVPVRPPPVPPRSSHATQPEVWPASAEPKRDAPSASAAVRVTAVALSKRWQLVTAVQALDALTEPAGELGAPP
jgi:hypothetical protein